MSNKVVTISFSDSSKDPTYQEERLGAPQARLFCAQGNDIFGGESCYVCPQTQTQVRLWAKVMGFETQEIDGKLHVIVK